MANSPIGIVIPVSIANEVFNGACLSRELLVPWGGGELPADSVALVVSSFDDTPENRAAIMGEIARALGVPQQVLTIGDNDTVPDGYHYAGASEPGKRFISPDLKPVVFCD